MDWVKLDTLLHEGQRRDAAQECLAAHSSWLTVLVHQFDDELDAFIGLVPFQFEDQHERKRRVNDWDLRCDDTRP